MVVSPLRFVTKIGPILHLKPPNVHTHTYKSNKSCVCSRIFFTFPRGLPQKQIDQTNSQPTDSALRLLFYACWVANMHIVTSYLKLFLNLICHGLWKKKKDLSRGNSYKPQEARRKTIFSKFNQKRVIRIKYAPTTALQWYWRKGVINPG